MGVFEDQLTAMSVDLRESRRREEGAQLLPASQAFLDHSARALRLELARPTIGLNDVGRLRRPELISAVRRLRHEAIWPREELQNAADILIRGLESRCNLDEIDRSATSLRVDDAFEYRPRGTLSAGALQTQRVEL